MKPRFPVFLSLNSIQFISNPNPKTPNFNPKFLNDQSQSLNHTQFPIPSSKFLSSLSTTPTNPNPNPNLLEFNSQLHYLLKSSILSSDSDFTYVFEKIVIKPTSSMLLEIFKNLDLRPEHALSLYKWAEKQSGWHLCGPVFDSMLEIVVKSGELKWALMVLFDKIKRGDGSELVSAQSFRILITHFARSGLVLPAIRVFELGSNLGWDVFEVLVAALCKYGHVKVASDCVDRRMCSDSNWVPSIDVYNMLLDGWFRVQNIEQVGRLWLRMRNEKLVFEVVSYGILVEGYCRMGFVDRAIGLLGDMRRCGVRPNKEVYGPIVDGLAREGRLKEAIGMLERFLVLESGPSLSNYNALIKGFCKAGDLDGAGKILKMMTSRGVMPTTLTYNYFFRYFEKNRKVEEGVDLYRKMVESGYDLDHRTFHLLLKILCEDEKFDLALEISKEMKSRGHLLDLGTSTMLINLLCKVHRLKEAVAEFEDLIQRGLVPKFLTYQTLHHELRKGGLHESAQKLSELVATVSPSATLPDNTFQGLAKISHQRKSIMYRAKVMSDVLKTCSDPRELSERRSSSHKTSSASKKTGSERSRPQRTFRAQKFIP